MVLPKDNSIVPRRYSSIPLSENFGEIHPMVRFKEWFDDAIEKGSLEPDAFTLSTFDGKKVQARTVALRGITEDGFLVYTNYHSRKAREMDSNESVALTFYFRETFRQIRISGISRRVSDDQSDQYFASRPRGSQVGAWVSRQSEKLTSREQLISDFNKYDSEFGELVPRPPFWGGYLIQAESFEFMQGQENRLHDRFVFTKSKGKEFICERLWP